MSTRIRHAVGQLMLLGGLAGAAATTWADCSRPIEVPMSPIGLSVSFDGDRAAGVYPTLLREMSAAMNCDFQMQRVPRARLQKMFESQQADLLIPASASPARDRDGEFVPLIQVRASLLTINRDRPAPRSLAELLNQPDYKLAVVRGFSFGPVYEATVLQLRQQKRVIEEADVTGVVRALREGLAHGTVMTASILIGTIVQDGDTAGLARQVRVELLDELGWSESGVYLSRQSLSSGDRRRLRHAFTQQAKAGRVWQLFTDTHPPGSLGGSIRPLP